MSENKEVYFKIDGRVVLALFQYLSTKPYGEVDKIIPILQRLEMIKEEKEIKELKPDKKKKDADNPV